MKLFHVEQLIMFHEIDLKCNHFKKESIAN